MHINFPLSHRFVCFLKQTQSHDHSEYSIISRFNAVKEISKLSFAKFLVTRPGTLLSVLGTGAAGRVIADGIAGEGGFGEFGEFILGTGRGFFISDQKFCPL